MAITLKLQAILTGTVTIPTQSVDEFGPAIREAAECGALSSFGGYLVKLLDEGKTEEAIKALLKHAMREGLKDFNQQTADEVIGSVQGNYKFAPAQITLTTPANLNKEA